MRRMLIPALFLLLASFVLGATVFREQIAWAEQLLSVQVMNDAAHPVPVAAPAPITSGGGAVEFVCGNTATPDAVATALSIHMTSGVFGVNLYSGTPSNTAAFFLGPEETGPSDVQLTLNRPIKFDHVQCIGLGTARISVSWVGNLP